MGPSFVIASFLGHTEVMADDDIERLLREVYALNNPSSPTSGRPSPEAATSKDVAKKDDSSGGGAGGRLAFAVGSGAVLGVAGWFGGLLMPVVGSFSAGVGAAFGAFVASLIAGPPRWFSS